MLCSSGIGTAGREAMVTGDGKTLSSRTLVSPRPNRKMPIPLMPCSALSVTLTNAVTRPMTRPMPSPTAVASTRLPVLAAT